MAVDLSTDYLGMRLKNPIIASACPLTGNVESLLRLSEAGVAAAVLPSIFEEQVEHDELELAKMLDFWALSSPESADYFPELDNYNTGPDAYLELIHEAKRQCAMPIIASLNGSSLGGWVRYAGLIEKAGADALEVNIYHVPTRPEDAPGSIDAQAVEIVRELKKQLKIPVVVKIGPYFSSLPCLARELEAAGADGMVLFNRFLAPDIDLETLQYVPALELSTPDELRPALRWIAILRDQVSMSLVATGGVHSSSDILKAVLAGANAVACASTLLRQGPQVIGTMRQELEQWLQDHDYESIRQMQGSLSLQHCPNPDGLKRANYMRALTSYTPSVH